MAYLLSFRRTLVPEMIRLTHMLSLQNPGFKFNKIGNVHTKLHCAVRSCNPVAMGTKQHYGIAVAYSNINATMGSLCTTD
jgi:ectoine hydroxylase-related dioxygenase (phytanoyl-CoA dioxygenase family)